MAILVNQLKLDVGIALRDEKHPMYQYALQYDTGVKELKDKFGKVIKFMRPGFPQRSKGTDSRGREVTMLEPEKPALFPLQRKYTHPERGEEIWACCLQMPELLPNGLWSIGKKKSVKINDFINIDLNKQPDLAFYLYYIAGFGLKESSGLRVDDPKKEIREKADRERQLVERKTAIWQMLPNEHDLRRMAAAYNVPNSGTKEPDQLRFDLEAQLEINDKKRGRDNVKGTKEFLEEMKVTDNVRLRAFLKTLEDDKKLVYKPDGRWHLGDKTLLQVPFESIKDAFGYMCSYYNVPNNADKLKDLMRDVVNKEYLDKITDPKDFKWIAKVMELATSFKKPEDVKEAVYKVFSIE